jgi:hypothetical protein
MNEVRKYKALGDMTPRSRIGGGDWVRLEDYDAAKSELAALREELVKANEKIDQAWNRSHAIDHKGFIPGALDAWKRPVPQHLPYDFSGNPGASATQYCNGWNDAGGYWSGHASDLQQRLTAAEQRNAEQLQELVKARNLIEQSSKFRASTFSECTDLIISLQAFVAETDHAGEYTAVRTALLNTVCNGYAQEQGHAVNQLRDLLDALKPTESGASE